MSEPKAGEWWWVHIDHHEQPVALRRMEDDPVLEGMRWDAGDLVVVGNGWNPTPIRRIPTAEELAELEHKASMVDHYNAEATALQRLHSNAVDDREALQRERDEARAEVERERLRYGQAAARNRVFMQILAQDARAGQQERAKAVMDAADAAAADVRLGDFVTVRLNTGDDHD